MIDATNPLKPVFVMSLDPALPSVSPVLRLGNVSYALGEALVPMAQRGPVRVALPPIAADERYGELAVQVDAKQSASSYVPIYRP